MNKPNIWNKKTNPDVTEKLRLPARAGKRKPITDVDVSFNNLKHLSNNESLTPIFEILRASCVGDNKENNCKIGTTYAYFSEDGRIHIDFASKIAFPKETQEKILRILQKWLNQ